MAAQPGRQSGRGSARLPWLGVGALTGAIFVADTATPIQINFSILYVAAVLLAARFARQRGIVWTALGCAFLATASFAFPRQPVETEIGPGVNLLIALASIATTTFIAVQGHSRIERVREQASLLDLTHDTIFVRGMDDVIRYWNRGAEELYGWPAELALGKVAHTLLETRFPLPIEVINAELGETGRWEGELVHTRRDGSHVVVATRWSLQRDREGRPALVLETNNDVTSRRRAEYLMGQVFEAVPDGMCVIGADFRVQRANPLFARHHSRPPESVVGAHLAELSGREFFERIAKPNVSRALTGEETTYSGWLPTPRGGRRYLRVSYSPLRPNDDQVEAVLLVGRDQTNEMRAAEALQAAQADLAHANRVATMGQLTASIAHEVSQPIHAVALSAKAALRWLAADPPANEEARNALARVVHNASLAGEVLARIRTLVKKAPPRRESFALDEAIRDVLALTASEADKTAVTVEPYLAADVPPVVGDRVQLQQVILNLVMNAIEAMSGTEGPRRLCVRTEPHSEGGVRVEVADTGAGLASETARRVFEPFFTTKPHGMGMGLSICRSIVEAHGGKLSTSPNEPRGTIFQFTLPAGTAGTVAEATEAEHDPV